MPLFQFIFSHFVLAISNWDFDWFSTAFQLNYEIYKLFYKVFFSHFQRHCWILCLFGCNVPQHLTRVQIRILCDNNQPRRHAKCTYNSDSHTGASKQWTLNSTTPSISKQQLFLLFFLKGIRADRENIVCDFASYY